MSFPSGVLRWTGAWSSTTEYRYGDIALASTNVSYACGVPTSLNVDPATQPSTDWFAFPSQGGGSPSTWSQFPATSEVVMGTQSIVDQTGYYVNSMTMNTGNDVNIQAMLTSSSSIYLQPNTTGSVIVGVAPPAIAPSSSLKVDKIENLSDGFGTAGQLLTSDGSKIQWINAVQTSAIEYGAFDISGGAEEPLWTTASFTPTVSGNATVNLSVTASSASDLSPRLRLDLLYIEDGAVINSAGYVIFIRPPGVTNPHEGYNGTFTKVFQTTAGSSYVIQLQTTCAVAVGVANPWKVLSSVGYIQSNLP